MGTANANVAIDVQRELRRLTDTVRGETSKLTTAVENLEQKIVPDDETAAPPYEHEYWDQGFAEAQTRALDLLDDVERGVRTLDEARDRIGEMMPGDDL